jgi:hypothetical protein
MSNLEIFELNENGAGWVSFENASTSTKLDLELALLTKAEVKMLCFKCHVEIPRGNVCVNHKNVRGAIYFAD